MYKVLIVDDEPIIRRGLINIVNWNEFNCMICGEAVDGVDGIEKVRELKPDIIITDINMPEVDGLKMIEDIKNEIPNSKIIILTGYRDFEYIQQAIKLGAFDYLLKPTKIKDISEVVKKSVNELNQNYSVQNQIKEYKELFKKSIPVLKERLFYDVMFKINTNSKNIKEGFELYKIQLNEFVMMLVEIDDEDNKISQYESNLYMFGIMNIFHEMVEKAFDLEKITVSNNQVAIIVKPLSNQKDFKELLYNKIQDLQQIIKDYFKITITVSISADGNGFSDLSRKTEECLEALTHKYYFGNNSILLYEDLGLKNTENISYELEEHQKILIKDIKIGNQEDVIKELEIIKSIILSAKNSSKEIIAQFYLNSIQSINVISAEYKLRENCLGDEMIISSFNILDDYKEITRLHEILENSAKLIVSKINSMNNKKINQVLQNALDYINQNYDKCAITLKDVSDYTYVSTFYLSRIFKKELNKNFVEYLNELRIEKAKEYLMDLQYKNYEIAEMVGVQDSRYFSKIFKKYVGITPSEYRAKYTSEQEI